MVLSNTGFRNHDSVVYRREGGAGRFLAPTCSLVPLAVLQAGPGRLPSPDKPLGADQRADRPWPELAAAAGQLSAGRGRQGLAAGPHTLGAVHGVRPEPLLAGALEPTG